MDLSILPDVLQDIVLQYAYNLPKKDILESLGIVLDILDMKLPFFFLRDRLWSWHFKMFLPNPIYEFMPIEYYNGEYADLFNDDAMYCFLLGLDFRRRSVRCFGTRQQWLDRIVCNWKAVRPFSMFYKMLLRDKSTIMKKRGPLIRGFV